MNRYQEITGRINYWLFLVVVFLLPYPQVVLRYTCVLWIISWFFEARWLSKPRSLKQNTMAIPFLLFGAWYAWKAFSGLWAADHAAWAWQMERYMAFGLMVPVGLWGLNKHYNWRQVGSVFVMGCTSAMVFYLIAMPFLFYHPDLVTKWHIATDWNFSLPDPVTSFSENLSCLKHRLFLCSTEMMGIVIAFRTLRNHKVWLVLAVIVMLGGILLSGSRQSILTGAALLAVAMVYALPRRYRLRYGVGILLLGVLLGGSLLMLHPRMQEFNFKAFTEIRKFGYTHDVRLNIWGVALQQPSDYIQHGVGAGQSSIYLSQRCQENGVKYIWQKASHSHNQYLEETIEIGIYGTILFILAWLSIPLCARKEGRLTGWLFTTLFMLNMFTDCMFGRFCGIALWSVIIIFVLLQSEPQRNGIMP